MNTSICLGVQPETTLHPYPDNCDHKMTAYVGKGYSGLIVCVCCLVCEIFMKQFLWNSSDR